MSGILGIRQRLRRLVLATIRTSTCCRNYTLKTNLQQQLRVVQEPSLRAHSRHYCCFQKQEPLTSIGRQHAIISFVPKRYIGEYYQSESNRSKHRRYGFVALCVLVWHLYFFKVHIIERPLEKELTRIGMKQHGTKAAHESFPKLIDKGSNKLYKYRKWTMPTFTSSDSVSDVKTLPIRDSDIVVASFPKSGTTWVQNIILKIKQKTIDNNSNLEVEFPYIEFLFPGVKSLTKRKGNRFLKTHLPHELLPEALLEGKGKLIYIARNPKDVSVSYFYFHRMMTEISYTGDYETFYGDFMNDRVGYAPWKDHVEDYWEHRKDKNVMFVTYEELSKNPAGIVKSIAEFLEAPLTDDQALEVAWTCRFSEMKLDNTINYSWWDTYGLRNKGEVEFLRQGKVGDWKNHLTSEMAGAMDSKLMKPVKDKGVPIHD